MARKLMGGNGPESAAHNSAAQILRGRIRMTKFIL